MDIFSSIYTSIFKSNYVNGTTFDCDTAQPCEIAQLTELEGHTRVARAG
jgi:hypothetical protein